MQKRNLPKLLAHSVVLVLHPFPVFPVVSLVFRDIIDEFRFCFKRAARSSSTGSRFSAALICLLIPRPLPSTDDPVDSSKNRSANAGK